MSPAPTDLAEVARAIVDELRAAEPGRAIELGVRGDARGMWDAARLGEVISNLVGNALTHGDGDPVRVTIDDGGDEVWLRVHNDGAAIAPGCRRACSSRSAAAATRGRPARGLGLGLYIVNQIVFAHAGEIGVESTASGGTSFIVRLPRRSDQNEFERTGQRAGAPHECGLHEDHALVRPPLRPPARRLRHQPRRRVRRRRRARPRLHRRRRSRPASCDRRRRQRSS